MTQWIENSLRWIGSAIKSDRAPADISTSIESRAISVLEQYFRSDLHDEFPQLVEKLISCHDVLRSAWQIYLKDNNVNTLNATLDVLVGQCNNLDVETIDIKLRADAVNCSAKILQAAIEMVAGDAMSVLRSLRDLAALEEIPRIWRIEFFANVAICEVCLRHGKYDEALHFIRKNLKVFSECPTSQLLRYRILLALKERGVITGSSEVYLGDMSDRFCSEPFETIATNRVYHGKSEVGLFACKCTTMLPYPISSKGGSVEDIWNGEAMKEIRRSVLDGDFTYCNRSLCPYIVANLLPLKKDVQDPKLREIIDTHRLILEDGPKLLSLTHDASCNLACPSCRADIITINKKERDALDLYADQYLFPLLEEAGITVYVSGNGDPFGSKHLRRFIHGLDPVKHGGVRLELLTNGLLLTKKEWDSLSHVHHMISSIAVSIDAATSATYEDVRRPGKWDILTQNMEFLGRLRREGKIPKLSINFVVQCKNFEEMPAFVELGERWSVDEIIFQKIVNNGSYTSTSYEKQNVMELQHPLHSRFLEVLQNSKLRSSIVVPNNVLSFLAKDSSNALLESGNGRST